MRRTHVDEPVLITSAPESADDEYDRRRKRYAITMSIRAVCVVAAAVTSQVSLWRALAFVAGAVVLPWCAVIVANDGPAKKRPRHPEHTAPMRTERALTSGDDRTING